MLQIVWVKYYIVTMTLWQPDLSNHRGPRYLAIAEALADDIAEGRLAAGDRLPTHRDLAWRLGVTVGTVSRAYAEAERRGLLAGEIGRGTFVLDAGGSNRSAAPTIVTRPYELINLRQAKPPAGPTDRALRDSLLRIAGSPGCAGLLGYGQEKRNAAFAESAALWLKHTGLDVAGSDIVATIGAQGAISICFSSFFEPGDRIAVGGLSYQGIQILARQTGIRFAALELDDAGLVPDSFEAACRTHQIKGLYCIPTLHNPTTATLSPERRAAIGEIAERYGVIILEDDIFRGLLDEAPPPFKALLPERTCYITSFSKTLAPGLRLGMLVPPKDLLEKARQSITARCITLPPLMLELARDWIDRGEAARLLVAAKKELVARNEILIAHLGRWAPRCPPGSPFAWLELPEPWLAASFAAEMRAQGVNLSTADEYAVGRQLPPRAVRIGIGAATSRDSLEDGLKRMAALLDKEPIATRNPLV